MTDISPSDLAKFSAARRSIDFVEDGMRLGLGTGSTAAWMVRCLAARARAENLSLICVPTSERTAEQARGLGLEVVSLDEAGTLDLTIDGADEFDAEMTLIKGGGGAHLREKIVASASARMIVIADPGKRVERLGAFPLPIEVVPFGLESSRKQILTVLENAEVEEQTLSLRMKDGAPFRTDEGNVIIDASLGRIEAPDDLSAALNAIPGVVDNGLFLKICDTVIVGHPDGRIATVNRDGETPSGQIDLGEAAQLPG